MCRTSVEKIDPVRFISNFSTGLQGYEIASSLANFGAKTILISGPTKLEAPKNVKVIDVESGNEFLKKSLENLPCDVFISVAAKSDVSVKKIKKEKIKKKKAWKNSIFIKWWCFKKFISWKNQNIGFSAETNNLLKNKKKIRMLVGFGQR